MTQTNEVTPQDPVERPSPGADPFPDVSDPLPPDAFPVTVEGRQSAGPDDGFGKLWHKRYRIRLSGVDASPSEVVGTWRERFGEFWPKGNRFYRPLIGLEPGEVALIDLAMPAGTRLSTGVVVEEASESAFTYVTTPGHMFAGRIVFSAYDDDGETVAQVEMWLRASDPLFEMSLPLGGHARDDRFWEATLQNLAAYFGASANPDTFKEAIDSHRQWHNWTNIVRNSYIRTAWHLVTLPFRRLAGRLTGSEHGR